MIKDINKLALQCETKICKICKKELMRYVGDKFPNGKDFKYLNEQGRQWNGRTCPDCHSTILAKKQKNQRDKKKLYV